MMAVVTRIVGLWAALAFAGVLVACGSGSVGPEAQVRAWIGAVQAAAEVKDRREIIDHISPSYSDARGNSRNDIENMLRVYFLRVNKIGLLSTIDELSVIDGTAAKVSVNVAMAGTDDRILGLSADAYRFELELTANGDDWQLISARWGELGGKLH